MVIERKKFFLHIVEVLLDDDQARIAIAQRRQLSYLSVVSYNGRLTADPEFHRSPKQVAWLPLDASIEQLLGRFNDTTQKHIRRTFKHLGLHFKSLDPDFAATYKAYVAFERAKGRRPFSPATLRDAMVFNAYLNGEIISSFLCYDTRPVILAHLIFSKRLAQPDHEQYKIISYASKRLVYEICQFGLSHGYSAVDLGPVNSADPAKQGIANFKLSFNPTMRDQCIYIYRSRLFRLVTALARLPRRLAQLAGI